MDTTTLGALSIVGHFSHLLPPTVPVDQQGLLFAGQLKEQLAKHKATIIQKDGTFQLVQEADNDLLYLVDGQQLSLKQFADSVFNVAQPTNQADNESVFRRQLSQSMEHQGIQGLPDSETPPSQSARYLQPFRRQLEQSLAAAEKNYLP